jgi:hypothetical protein
MLFFKLVITSKLRGKKGLLHLPPNAFVENLKQTDKKQNYPMLQTTIFCSYNCLQRDDDEDNDVTKFFSAVSSFRIKLELYNTYLLLYLKLGNNLFGKKRDSPRF